MYTCMYSLEKKHRIFNDKREMSLDTEAFCISLPKGFHSQVLLSYRDPNNIHDLSR